MEGCLGILQVKYWEPGKVSPTFNCNICRTKWYRAGALKIEFLTKIFEIARRELFAHPDQKSWCEMPKGTGGILHIFKIFGVILANSLLQERPNFNHLARMIVQVFFEWKRHFRKCPTNSCPSYCNNRKSNQFC